MVLLINNIYEALNIFYKNIFIKFMMQQFMTSFHKVEQGNFISISFLNIITRAARISSQMSCRNVFGVTHPSGPDINLTNKFPDEMLMTVYGINHGLTISEKLHKIDKLVHWGNLYAYYMGVAWYFRGV